MLRNYLLVAYRNLLKNKSYVLINTFGLGIALACCVTSYILVAFNIEFDSYHKADKVENIYKVHTHLQEKDGEQLQNIMAPLVMSPVMAQDITGIEKYTRFIFEGAYVRSGDNAFSEGIAFADSTFYEMFDFQLIKGDLKSFKDKYTIILSEDLAEKYFPDENPVGQTMILNFTNQKEISVVVGAVIKDMPLNNTFVFEAMMRMEHFYDIHNLASDAWGEWRDPATFIELTSAENVGSVNELMDQYIPVRNEAKKDQNVIDYKLEPFKANFTQDEINWSQVNLRIEIVPLLVFTTMAGMILLIACFNLTNTSIAMTAKRLKEVGVRKVVGASKFQIIVQFLLEMVITILLSLLVGLILSRFIVPAFSDMWNLNFGLEDMNGLNLFVTLIILVFIASLLAGIYPALFNSRFKPVTLLKGRVRVKGTNALTKSLVAAQFAISVIVLVAGVIFIQNSRYQETIKFGYDKEMVLNVFIQNESEYGIMDARLRSNPKVIQTGLTNHQLGGSSYMFPIQIDTADHEVRHFGIGEGFFEVMGLTLLEGRYPDYESPAEREQAIVVNQAFVAKLGLENPFEQWIMVHEKRRRIVGILDNYVDNLFWSAEAEPVLFYASVRNELSRMLVRANADDLADLNGFVEEEWKAAFPTKPYNSRFQDDIVLGQVLQTNRNLEKIFLFLTVLGGLLSASGIFSLATLNVEKRTKEIGIRKALGASVQTIVGLLNKEFVIILSIAGILGSIGGYFLTAALLDEIYSQHITVGWVSVILCALFIFLVGIATTSSTILSAARMNPVETLRDE